MTYGGSVPTITPSYSGFVNGDTSASLTNPPTCDTTATSSSAVTSYPSSCSGAIDSNYAIVYVSGSVNVNPASLTITASSPTMAVNTVVPAITPGYAGFVNGDSASSLATQPTCGTTADGTVTGNFPTTCSGAADGNYSITEVPGTLTVQ
jgi:hypothetical protein